MTFTKIIIQRIRRDSGGFTLLEAVISLLVLSIGILGMAALQTNAVSSNTLAEQVQENTVAAMAEIEELMATDFNDARFLGDDITNCYNAADPAYNICVRSLDNDAIPGAKRVVVTSAFTQLDGSTQTVTFKIFKPDIK